MGSNIKRHEIYEQLSKGGANYISIVHPRALVAHDVVIGKGSYIGAYAILAAGTVAGVPSRHVKQSAIEPNY